MPVPKRRSSKGRVRRKRNTHYHRSIVQSQTTKDKKAIKRPHIEEYIEL